MRTVELSSINLNDKTFLISYPDKPSPELIRSIKKVNILNPVILRTLPSSQMFQIITGFKRIRAAHILHIDTIPAHVYENQALKDSEALMLALYDNTSARVLNIIEKTIVIGKCISLGIAHEDTVIRTILPLLDIEANRYMFEKLMTIKTLTSPIQKALAEESITRQTAEHLLHLPVNERNTVFAFIKNLAVGKHKAETLSSLILDISKHEHISCRKLLSEYALAEIISKKDVSATDRYHQSYRYLFGRRYPLLSRIQEDIRRIIQKLNLPHNITIQPPLNLEGDSYTLVCTLKNKQDISLILKVLKEIKKNPAFAELFKNL